MSTGIGHPLGQSTSLRTQMSPGQQGTAWALNYSCVQMPGAHIGRVAQLCQRERQARAGWSGAERSGGLCSCGGGNAARCPPVCKCGCCPPLEVVAGDKEV